MRNMNQFRYLYPGINIIWQLLQKRIKKTWLLPEGQPLIDEIRSCNIKLTELATEMNFNTIRPDIPIECVYDGLQPTAYGVAMLEITIHNYLKKKQNDLFFFFFNSI